MNKIIIFGMGSIGRRYASILQNNADIELYAFREKGKDKIGNMQNIFSFEEIPKTGANVAIIANPTFMHIETAISCAQNNMHLFIEKPLDMSLDRIQELEKLVKQNNLTCYIAYNLRFHPGIIRLKEILAKEELLYANIYASSYLPFWRKGKDYRDIYSAKKDLGGGIALDLSHEFDYVSYIFGGIENIRGYLGKVSDLEIDCNDLADVSAKVCKNKRVQIHLDFCSLHHERQIKVITKNNAYKLDLINNMLEISKIDGSVDIQEYKVDNNYTYIEQIKYFLNNIGNKDIMNSLAESACLLKQIIEFKNKAGKA